MKNFLHTCSLLLSVVGFCQIPTANLIAYYPFCGNANDMSGHGLNGTVNGATLTFDRFGQANSAYNFNGINSYIDLPSSSFVGLDVYSYSMWIKPGSNAGTGFVAYSVGTAGGTNCLTMNYNAPSIFAGSYNLGNNPVQSYVYSPALPNINNWIHVVVTRDMSTLKLYVNSALAQQFSAANTSGQSADYGTAPHRAAFGTRSNLSYYFPGQIDDARIYSSVLSQNDVNALYNESSTTISVSSGTICYGDSFFLVPSGASSYTYSSGSALVSPTSTSIYTVTGNNGSNCIVSSTATVTVYPQFSISVNSGTVCNGGLFFLDANGANAYIFPNNSPFVSPNSTSVYTVTGINGWNCRSSSTATVTVYDCTGIEQLFIGKEITIHPNPSSGSFIIKLDAIVKGAGRFTLLDLQGRIIRTYFLEGDELKIDNVSKGCYVGELTVYEKVLFKKKILITDE